MIGMAKKPKAGDRHGPRNLVNVPPEVHAQLRKLAERNCRPISWELRLALIKHLEEAGLWPPEKGGGQ
jgi:hypothetical protein